MENKPSIGDIRDRIIGSVHPDIRVGRPVPLSACRMHKSYLLSKAGLPQDKGSVLMLAVPYYTTYCERKHNVSVYSVSEDYHLYFKALFEDLVAELESAFPGVRFAGFADHSPIQEVHAAMLAGLGVIGANHLLITKEYGSYVFLGEIITDLETKELTAQAPSFCLDCQLCRKICPVGSDMTKCLSALTQKKGPLSPEEESVLSGTDLLWGCDLCQDVCPLNHGVRHSAIPFFGNAPIPELTSEVLDRMDAETFSRRAYSWRGRAVPERNLRLHQDPDSDRKDTD